MIRYDVWPHVLCLIEALKEQESYCGATHIQKAAYLLGEVTGASLCSDFHLYHHGPYSFDLRETLVELEAAEAIRLLPNPPYGPIHQITDQGYGFWSQFEKPDFDEAPIIFIASKVNSKDVKELEALGTAALVQKEMPDGDLTSWTSQLKEYKPHIDTERIRKALIEVTSWKAEWHQNQALLATVP